MEPENNQPAVTEAGASHLLPYDIRELEKVSGYSTKKVAQTQKLSDDVDKMGQLRLIWDSKMPEKNKKFYNFVSFSSSNREEIVAEIQKYLDFYKELNTAARVVNRPHSDTAEKANSKRVDPFLMIVSLNEHLTKMIEVAKLGKGTTGSSIVYNLHKTFVARHEKLESMIKRVECIALKEGMKKANEGWQESVRVIGRVTKDWERAKMRYEDMCGKFERLMNEHEKLLAKHKD